MIKNMLIAASKMLETAPKESGVNFKARVFCAKTIIDEIVSGMGQSPISSEEIEEIKNAPTPLKIQSPRKAPSENAKNGKVTVDQGRIKSIEGVDLETTMIDLDGQVMTCAQAIGKAFQHGKIL